MKIIAHRGARSLAPENTLAAFRKAMALPADIIEGDVALTLDHQPVMIHQETLEPDGNFEKLCLAARNEARAWISSYSGEEVNQLDAGSWFSPIFAGERIPKLEDVLGLGWTEKELILDLIDPYYWLDEKDSRSIAPFASAVVPKISAAAKSGARINVLAFNPLMLELFKKELPDVPRTLAIWRNQRGKEKWIGEIAGKLKVSVISIADFMLRDEPSWEMLARDSGIALGVYELTPDSHSEFREWTPKNRYALWDLVIEKRVDYFTTDFPAEFAAYKGKKELFGKKR
jgi:glycerophosphoryl diester phosphodiesterase